MSAMHSPSSRAAAVQLQRVVDEGFLAAKCAKELGKANFGNSD